ncbi:integral membrane protein MviN [Thermodesulfatator indicus DSM 15286]|uniref:Probable lipid II flippase MurJ n=1 Tax=Thermodesulfatator indicus (strain DSM 15286 / JCM 11887 / CIR29812) TaxID=667014 RepID=F8A8H0_THEID|nr:murein biosynthesis integral membrane protein MurJ [Thermodesulfatator indicus]AEH43978.1 integral membrane protein MviN [Thermodesulfatator indicus DSM 15286]
MSQEQKAFKKIASGARAVTIAVLLSRLLGLIREQVLAGFFGAGLQMDAYVVAYRIPNLLRDLLAEGALATAFVTVFTQHKEKYGLEKTWRLAGKALGTVLVLVIFLVLLGELFAPYLVGLLAPGFKVNPEKLQLATFLTRIMFPFLALISTSAVIAGMLNSLGTFFLPAASSAVFNLISILTGVSLYFVFVKAGVTPITAMAIGVIAGGIAQVGIQTPAIWKKGFRFKLSFAPKDPYVKEIFKLMAPAVIGLSAVQLNIFINTYFASLCEEGSLSWLSYAFRLMYVPLGLFGVALATAILPVVSAQAARKDFFSLRSTYASAILMAQALALPSAVGLIILAKPIVRIIFERGQFGPADTIATATALSLFSISLPAYALTKVTAPVFYALHKPKIPMLSSFLSVAVNLLTVTTLVKTWGFKAVALGMSLGIVAQAIFQVVVLTKKLEGIEFTKVVSGLARILLATFGLGLIAFYGDKYLKSFSGLDFTFGLLGLIVFCAVFYFGLIRLIGPREGLYLFRFRTKK